MINFSVFKILGVFATIMILLLFFGGTAINLVGNLRDGDFKGVLSDTGGKVFMIDDMLKVESEYLLVNSADPSVNVYDLSFHLTYGLSILFMLFFVSMGLFKLFNWASGKAQWSPGTDILIVLLIFAMFFALQFLYSVLVLDRVVVPLSGVWAFLKALPGVLQNVV